MSFQTVFRRYEIKYMVTRQQKEMLIRAMEPHMELDCYGHSTIRNLYYDTDRYRLVRRSLERPVYKEKMRVRCYEKAAPESPVFVELKKKYQSVVYKRRLALPEQEAIMWLAGKLPKDGIRQKKDIQIAGEIEYFCRYYESLHPVVFLSYEREAYRSRDGSDFRVTFDENILARREELSLCREVWGAELLPEECLLMEIKTAGGIPLWMSGLLTEHKIYHTPFSKYGKAYEKMIFGGERDVG